MASRLLTIILLLLWPFLTEAQPDEVRFQRLTYAGGLSDQKVNCILKSRDGYLWLGTPLGLNRFDGLRVHSFYNHPGDANSLPDNTILGLSEDAEGMLWVETPAGFCIFNPITDKVERNTSLWLSQCGMKGKVLRVASDGKRNLWIVTDQYRLYYYDFSSKKALLVAADKGALAHISFLFPKGERCLLTSANGTVAFADLQKRRVVSVDRSIADHCGKSYPGFSSFVDSCGGIWLWSTLGAWHYDAKTHRWNPIKDILVSGVAEDSDHHILMATDHDGLVIVDLSGNIITRILNNPSDGQSLPDNTLQTIYVDNLGVVWIGMYRMGLAYFLSWADPLPTSLPGAISVR
jgi:ligand-binding sensor domain-containing protein